MSKKCDICNSKLGLFNKYDVINGTICSNCIRISKSYKTDTIENLRKYWSENDQRFSKFNATTTLKSFGSTPIIIDNDNKLFIVGKITNKPKNIVYSFREIKSYNYETIGEKTITKKKGTISRAVVGDLIAGPIGAAIGANTAKEETKVVGGMTVLNINLIMQSGNYKTSIAYPPTGFVEFLDKCIIENNIKNN